MLFNSLEYLLFLPVVFILHRVVPKSLRWLVLLIASYFFYMSWKWSYAGLIMASTLVDFAAGKLLSNRRNRMQRGLILGLSISFNVSILFLFKYLGLFSEIGNSIAALSNSNIEFNAFDLLLPVGISFYTFQTMSYTIDVFRGRKEAESHLGYFALFVCFFPQLVAGPIERAGKLLPRLKVNPSGSANDIDIGLRLIIWGLFKKIVLADRLSFFVDSIFSDYVLYSTAEHYLAMLFFSLQLYFDFSAYSDMAVGSARLFGIRLSQNFNNPLFSDGFQEFWKRWHITLSTWFKDYLYIPLGGNRNGTQFLVRNILITFIISGLWHGANLTFAIWGLVHGIFLLIEKLYRSIPAMLRLPRWTTGMIVFLGWTLSLSLFRAPSVSQAFEMLYTWKGDGIMFSFIQNFLSQRLDMLILAILVPFVFVVEYKYVRYPVLFDGLPRLLVILLLSLLVFLILFFPFPAKPFVYFQF